MAQADQARMQSLQETAQARGIDLDGVVARLKAQRIETPSWGYGDSGTRFKVFRQPAAARDVREKVADAATVHKYTGIAPAVALHIPWDKVDDWEELSGYAREQGVQIGAINPNLFQDDEYKLGSLAHPDEKIRRRAVAHVLECIEIMRATGSKDLSLWLADGTNYPGQDDMRSRKRRLADALAEIHEALDEGMRLLIEYKFYEPAFYSTDIADWGMALLLAQKAGGKASVLVDLGHHAQGVNIEQIVAILLDEGRLGGFHFNSRKYGDDDLTTGSIDPYQLFLIFCELAADEAAARRVAYMIDQSHNVKPKIEAMIQSVLAIQRSYARSLLVDRRRLAQCQAEGDIVGAEECLAEAYETDVTPLLERVRAELGVPLDPLAAYRASGHAERLAKERAGRGPGVATLGG